MAASLDDKILSNPHSLMGVNEEGTLARVLILVSANECGCV